MARFIEIENRETGLKVMIDTYEARYRRLAMGFLNQLKLKKYFLKHVILTQAKESYHPRILNNFMNQMRRRYPGLVAFWTIEVQEERREKYGEAVLHWHIIIGIPWNPSERFGSEDLAAITGYWKYGGCEIVPYRGNSLAYLMKYVTKALHSDIEAKYQLRRLGSSRLGAWLRQSWTKIEGALKRFEGWPVHPSELLWGHKGAYVMKLLEVPLVILNKKKGTVRVIRYERDYLYRFPASGWFKLNEFNEVPF